MTTAPSSHHHPDLYRAHALGGREVRRGLEALLRRRVPHQEVEDVAQTVLADALEASVIPTDPDELRRWLTGIARHKIADFHRRSARSKARLASSDDARLDVDAFAASPVAFEEREVLHALLGEKRSRREAETMEWLIREHAGERLADIASENGVPAPVVRQRVSRLRRALRSRWTGVIAVVAIVSGLSVLGAAFLDAPTEAIAPDPAIAAAPLAPASATPADLVKLAEGDWLVRNVHPDRPLTPVEQKLVDREAVDAKLSIQGKKITLQTRGGFKTSWRVTRLTRLEKSGGTAAHLVLVNETGPSATADVVFLKDEQGPRLDVTLHDPRFGGTVTLRRPVR